jgi:putative effector of murein hydrolase
MPEHPSSAAAWLNGGALPWLALTLGAWALAAASQRALRGNPWANPVLLASAIVVAALAASGVPYTRYLEATQALNTLLGSAVVALAVPLRRHWPRVRAVAPRLIVAAVAGQVVAALLAVGVLAAFGAPRELLLTIAAKSVTAPVAMEISARQGGVPALAAVLVVATGMLGAMSGATVFRALRSRDAAPCGLALGVAAHGIGTARAFQALGTVGGTFAAVGMTTSTVAACVVVPLVARLL